MQASDLEAGVTLLVWKDFCALIIIKNISCHVFTSLPSVKNVLSSFRSHRFLVHPSIPPTPLFPSTPGRFIPNSFCNYVSHPLMKLVQLPACPPVDLAPLSSTECDTIFIQVFAMRCDSIISSLDQNAA